MLNTSIDLNHAKPSVALSLRWLYKELTKFTEDIYR